MRIKSSKIEYLKHHINFANGCAIDCKYCYMTALYKRKYGHPRPTKDIEFDEDFSELVQQVRGGFTPRGDVMLSTSHDPFMKHPYPATRITKAILAILSHYPRFQGKIRTLTKSYVPLKQDFPLDTFNGVKFGVSVTTLDDWVRETVEPNAASVDERIQMLQKVKTRYGCYTWVSAEPMLVGMDLAKLLNLVEIDEIWVGPMNYCPVSKSLVMTEKEIKKQVRGLKKDKRVHTSIYLKKELKPSGKRAKA